MEEKSYYELWPILPYEKNEKYEYELYNSLTNEYRRERLRFTISFESIEEWFLGMSYLIGHGWYNSMKFKYSFAQKDETTFYWMEGKKQRVKERLEPVTIDNFTRTTHTSGVLVIDIVVDYDRLDEFRNTLKEWAGFVTWWLAPNCRWGNQDNKEFLNT